MEFLCPACGNHTVKLTDRRCARCRQSLTVQDVSRLYWERTLRRLRTTTAVQCPGCHRPNPISAIYCQHCGSTISIDVFAEPVIRPAKKSLRSFFSRPPRCVLWPVQLALLGLSGWGCYSMGQRVVETLWWRLLIGGAFCALFLSAIFFAVSRLFPRTILSALAHRASATVKLALVLNGFTVIFYAMPLFGHRWSLALAPAIALAAVLLAANVLARMIWPEFLKVREVFQDRGAGQVDPTKPQGRKAYRDE